MGGLDLRLRIRLASFKKVHEMRTVASS